MSEVPPGLVVKVRLLCPYCEGGVRITIHGTDPAGTRPVRCPYEECGRMFTYTPEPPTLQARMEGDPDA